MTSQVILWQDAVVEASLPTFAEGPGDEFKDGLGEFHEPKSASFGAAAHSGRGEASFAVSTQKR